MGQSGPGSNGNKKVTSTSHRNSNHCVQSSVLNRTLLSCEGRESYHNARDAVDRVENEVEYKILITT